MDAVTVPATVPLTGMRGAIARNMEQGWRVPRVAQSVEVDVTALQALRAAAPEDERVGLTAYVLRAVALCLREHPRLWEPLFSIVEASGEAGQKEEWIDAQDWCTGFLQAMDLQPEAWQAWRQDAELGPTLRTITLLGGDEPPEPGSEEAEALDDPEARDAMARQVVEGVLAMHARRYGAPQSPKGPSLGG